MGGCCPQVEAAAAGNNTQMEGCRTGFALGHSVYLILFPLASQIDSHTCPEISRDVQPMLLE